MAYLQAPVQTPKSQGPILLYWGGKVTKSDDVGYEGGVTQLLKIPSSTSYSGILSKIHQITGYSQDEYRLKLICKWPTDGFSFALVTIFDDESTTFMFGLFNKMYTVELFVEAGQILRSPVGNWIGGLASRPVASPSLLDSMPQPSQPSSNQHSNQQRQSDSVQAQTQHTPQGHVPNPPQHSKNSHKHNRQTINVEVLCKDGEDSSDDDDEEHEVVILDQTSPVESSNEPPSVVARTGKSIWLDRTFPSKEALQLELRRWSLARRVRYNSQFYRGNFNKPYCVSRCVNPDCKWSLSASERKDSRGQSQWHVNVYNEEHSCINPLRFKNHQLCSSSFISDYIMPVFKANFFMHVREIMELVKSEFCIDITCSKAYYARKKALKRVDGSESCLPPSRQNPPHSRPGNVNKQTVNRVKN